MKATKTREKTQRKKKNTNLAERKTTKKNIREINILCQN